MTTFGDLVTCRVLAIGDGYRAKNEELGEQGPIFLRSGYLQDNGWVLSEPDRLSSQPTGGFGSKVAQLDDTVLTTKGNSLGRLGLVTNAIAGSIYSPHLSFWRSLDREKLHPRYLYYWAHSAEAQHQVRARSHSTDMAPYLSLADQLALQIELPAIETQRTVADCLGALDDKIDLNRRTAGTLEAMARALFRSWFVDFDPVHARAEGRPTSLPHDVATLFPDSFGEGGLPGTWAGVADDIAELIRISVQPRDVQPTTPYVGLEHLERGSLILYRHGVASDVDSLKHEFRTGDLLFGKLRPYFNKVAIAPFDGVCSSDIFVFRARSGAPASLLYLSFSEPAFVATASRPCGRIARST